MHKFRDTLFKRYNDVSFLLSTIKWEDLPEFLSVLFDGEFDDQLWQIYLSNPFRTDSFGDFKQKIIESAKPKEQVETEAQKAAKNALAMLEDMGGDGFGV